MAPTLILPQTEAKQVAPGVLYYHERIESAPWDIHIATIDLNNPYVEIGTVLSNDQIGGHEKTSQMTERAKSPDRTPVAAINADFFDGNGRSVNAQIIDGMLIRKPYIRSVFALDTLGVPLIDVVHYHGYLAVKGDTIPINGINEGRDADEMILYNRYNGSVTHTNRWGSEMSCRYIDSPTGVNAPFRVQVIGMALIDSLNAGNTMIPDNGIVLSGHGTASKFIRNNVSIGDTMTIMFEMGPQNNILKTMIGGTPRIIRNGKISIENNLESISDAFATNRHPRTAIGFNSDSTMLYLFTVDGRQPGFSVGMSLQELAQYMISWGVTEALNLDGGGSTTFVLDGQVVNSPSDADGERAVANALVVYNTAPIDTVQRLAISPNPVNTIPQSPFTFTVTAYDKYLHKIQVPLDQYNIRYDTTTIERLENNEWQVIEPVSPHKIIVSYRAVHETLAVHLETIKYLEFSPRQIELQPDSSIQFYVQAQSVNGDNIIVTPELFQWIYNRKDLRITPEGLITGLRESQDTILLKGPDSYYTIPYVIGSLESLNDSYFKNAAEFSTNISSGFVKIDSSESNAILLDYQFDSEERGDLILTKQKYLPRNLRYIQFDVFGDGSRNWLRMELSDHAGKLFLFNITPSEPGINWENQWHTIKLPVNDLIPHWNNPGQNPESPLAIEKVYLISQKGHTRKQSGIGFRNMQYICFSKPEKDFAEKSVSQIGIAKNPDEKWLYLTFPKSDESFHMKIMHTNGIVDDISDISNDEGKYQYNMESCGTGVFVISVDYADSTTFRKIINFIQTNPNY